MYKVWFFHIHVPPMYMYVICYSLYTTCKSIFIVILQIIEMASIPEVKVDASSMGSSSQESEYSSQVISAHNTHVHVISKHEINDSTRSSVGGACVTCSDVQILLGKL